MSGTQQSRWPRSSVGALFLILSLTLCTASLPAKALAPVPPSAQAEVYPVTALVKEDEDPLKKGAGTRFACQSASALTRCYSPQQIRAAYNITPLLEQGITGVGRRIVIVDAYQSPTIVQDLHDFDRVFGLPDPVLKILAPDGLTSFNPLNATQITWASEISLDVEWAHAIAPGAQITLVLAKGAQYSEMLSAIRFAVETDQGDVISQSFTIGESCASTFLLPQHQIFQEATAKGITLLAASGDTGAAAASHPEVPCGGTLPYFLSTQTPASDPLVTSVGGTRLDADANTGHYISETTWNETSGVSGGGFSSFFARPFYQDGAVKNEQRGVPDVAFNAAQNGGVLVFCSSCAAATNPTIYGGTSAGSPQWAGIVALADQMAGKRLGFINPAIYRIGQSPSHHTVFHDIVSGNNTFVKLVATAVAIVVIGYDATSNWDAATGWGTPIVSALVPLLIANKQVTVQHVPLEKG